MDERLVRLLIREVLLSEEDYGGIGAGGYGDYGYGYGGGAGGYMGGWGGKNLASVFGSPFLDVAKTAIGSGKEVAAQVKGVARTGLEAALALVIPFVSGHYSKISEETHKEVQGIRKQYESLYKANFDALFNTDLVTLAFFLNPAAVVTGAAFDKLIYATPDVATKLLGFFIPISKQKLWNAIVRAVILHRATGDEKKSTYATWDDYSLRRLYANVHKVIGTEGTSSQVHREAVDRTSTSTQDAVKGIFRDPIVQQAMKDSEQAQKLRSFAKKTLATRLSKIYDLAKRVTTAPSPEALGKLAGADLKGVNGAALEKMKAAVKERLAKSLAAELEGLQKSGVDPAAAGLSKAYEKTIGEINGLPVNTAPPQNNVGPRSEDKDGEKADAAVGSQHPGKSGPVGGGGGAPARGAERPKGAD